jgi:hypothetical protein
MAQVLRTIINPGVGLMKTLENWNAIAQDLQEKPRKRTRQLLRISKL